MAVSGVRCDIAAHFKEVHLYLQEMSIVKNYAILHPMTDITFHSPSFFEDCAGNPNKHVHIVLIATKPDIIKQVPLYKELQKRGHLVILGHTGQHYDENLSGGMLTEFGVQPDFNLNVR